MFLDDKKSDFFFSQLSQFKVEDKNGKNIGKPGDALFTKDFRIDSLILFGGLLEEKMEDLHLRENVDPIVPISVIQTVDETNKKIVLNVAKDELKSTNNSFVAPEGLMQFIKLKKLPIFEKNNEKIGRVVDIFFEKDGKFKLIVGGGALEEFLEKVRVIPDKDLIVPGSSLVGDITDKITIKLDKMQLLSTLEEVKDDPNQLLTTDKVSFIPRGMNR